MSLMGCTHCECGFATARVREDDIEQMGESHLKPNEVELQITSLKDETKILNIIVDRDELLKKISYQ